MCRESGGLCSSGQEFMKMKEENGGSQSWFLMISSKASGEMISFRVFFFSRLQMLHQRPQTMAPWELFDCVDRTHLPWNDQRFSTQIKRAGAHLLPRRLCANFLHTFFKALLCCIEKKFSYLL